MNLFSDKGYTPAWCKEHEEENRKEIKKMIDRNEILQALRVISATCLENVHTEGSCKECPLRSQNIGGGCGIIESEPEMWDIVNEEHWHAFV